MLSFFFVKDGRQSGPVHVLVHRGPARAPQAMGERARTVLSAYVRGVVAVATMDAVPTASAPIIVGVPSPCR